MDEWTKELYRLDPTGTAKELVISAAYLRELLLEITELQDTVCELESYATKLEEEVLELEEYGCVHNYIA